MRFPALAVLAFVASGCTIHVVEQPASPVMVAEAPPPGHVHSARPRPAVYVPVTPTPATAPIATHTPVATRSSVAARVRTTSTTPPHRHPPQVATPAPRPSPRPFKTVPVARTLQLASVVPTKDRRSQKVKKGEPVELVSSTRVAKAQ